MKKEAAEKKGNFILWFSELGKESVPFVGGKGANLGEIYNLKVPVPPGFVVTTEAYHYFLEKSGLNTKIKEILSGLDYEDTKELEKRTKEIRELVVKAKMPADLQEDIIEAYENLNVEDRDLEKSALKVLDKKEPIYVAVRSSATAEDLADASFAGQQDSFVNVRGDEQLLEHIKKCFASLYTARATYYRNKKGFLKEARLAAVVQRMVNSDKSGVMFSQDPQFKNDYLIIEAVFGLGEGIVSGKITPDRYTLARKDFKIVDEFVPDKKIALIRGDGQRQETIKLSEKKSKSRVLTNSEIIRLAELGMRLEKHYKKPQDIEFAIEGEGIYLVQTRAVTTIGSRVEKGATEIKGEVLLNGIAASPGVGVGVVRIVRSMDDLDKIKTGDILVTKMTNPDMVVSMQKSTGIITEEGGLTCFGGDTKVLTNRGFMTIKEATEMVNSGEELILLAYNCKNFRPVWKKIISASGRKRQAMNVSISQTGRMEDNSIEITPDHKVFIFNNRQFEKKEIIKVIGEKDYISLLDSLPSLSKINEEKKAYLMGALLSDGHIRIDKYTTGNPRRGTIIFTQKPTESKELFINTVKQYFEESFGDSLGHIRQKFSSGNIRGRLVQGYANDYSCYNLAIAQQITTITQNLASWILRLDDSSCLNFLAGLIDGDGCLYKNRLHIYADKENVLQGIILACMNLGIFPQITKNRTIYHIQILEKLGDILRFTRRVKGDLSPKILGNKLFSAKALFSDIIEEINYKGRIKPYVKNNLLIDSRKIREYIMPLAKDKTKEELFNVINSGLRMQRVLPVSNAREIMVYNLEIEADDELDHNFVVFTRKYTPLLVSNSHAAIVSREMGIPAVVGTGDATKRLKDGDVVTVDGSGGRVFKGKVAETQKKEIRKVEAHTKTELKLIVDLPTFAERASQTGLKKIGLTRIEGIIAESGKHPDFFLQSGQMKDYEEIIYKGISKIAEYFDELWVRTSDIRTDEFQDLKGAPKKIEINPMLGMHGIRYGLKHPEVLKAELKALKRVAEKGKKIGILSPQIISVNDIKGIKRILREIEFTKCDVGVMVETPAAVQIINDLCNERIDFISFGTNDLTQYTLAIDRGNELVQEFYNEMDPSVLHQLEYVIRICKKAGVKTSICGQAGSRKEMVKFLVEKGIDSISVNADVAADIAEYVKELESKR